MQSSANPDFQLLYSAFAAADNREQVDQAAKLKSDTSESGKKYRYYIERLTALSKHKSKESINREMTQFLKEIFYDALIYHQIDLSRIHMEICIAGSLARQQATPFSDIDCFLIFGDSVSDDDKKNVIEIADKVTRLCAGFFEDVGRFAMDPVGISLSRMCGNVSEIVQQVNDLQDDAHTNSIFVGKSISGNNTLLEKLQNVFEEQMTPDRFYRMAIRRFPGPSEKKQINIKSDIIRPIDFLLQGLRLEEKMSIQEFDSADKILAELLARKRIGNSTAQLILYIQRETYELRRSIHEAAGMENDVAEDQRTKDSVKNLVDLVGWLRGSLVDYVNDDGSDKVFNVVSGRYLSNDNDKPNETQLLAQRDILDKIKNDTLKSETQKYTQRNIYEIIEPASSPQATSSTSSTTAKEKSEPKTSSVYLQLIKIMFSHIDSMIKQLDDCREGMAKKPNEKGHHIFVNHMTILSPTIKDIKDLRTAMQHSYGDKKYEEVINLFNTRYLRILDNAQQAIGTQRVNTVELFGSHKKMVNEKTDMLCKMLQTGIEAATRIKVGQVDIANARQAPAPKL